MKSMLCTKYKFWAQIGMFTPQTLAQIKATNFFPTKLANLVLVLKFSTKGILDPT